MARRPASWRCCGAKTSPASPPPSSARARWQQLQDVLPVLEMALSPEERAACDELNPPGSVVADFHNSTGWMKMKIPA